MKKFNIKKILLLLFWIATILGYEFVYRWMLFRGSFGQGILQIIAFALPAAVLVYTLTTLFNNKKINKTVSVVILLALFLVFFAQMIYYGIMNSVFTTYALSGTGEALGFGKLILNVFKDNYYRIAILFAPLIIMFIFGKYIFDYSRNKGIFTGISFASYVLLTSLTFVFVNMDKKDIYSSYNLYFNTQAPVLSAKKFGLLPTMGIDINRTLFGFEEKSVEMVIENQKPNNAEKAQYNIMDIDFEKLIANESNQKIVSMHKYFESLSGTKKNQYTGMFKGKNVIYMLAESLDPIAIDPVLTPTLYKLANSGFNFTNYYSPQYPQSTADGQFRTEWGLISSRGSYDTLYYYRNVYNPFSYANSFKDYNLNVYHNWTGAYYARDQYFKAQGYPTFKTCYNGLDMYCNLYSRFHASDLYMVNSSVKDYINSETPFFSYYITVSGHLDYMKYDNEMVQKHWDSVKDLPYTDRVKGYIAANMELDKALESLINQLQTAGKLDNTVFVISPDHYPYKLNGEEINEVSTIDRNDDLEIAHSDFIIWNSAMTDTIQIDKVGSQTDVLPTVLNLFGVDYDSRLLVGQDLLSDSEGLVAYSNRSWITDKGRYNSVTEENSANDGGVLSQEYVDKINTKVSNEFIISNKILESNYYKKVFTTTETE